MKKTIRIKLMSFFLIIFFVTCVNFLYSTGSLISLNRTNTQLKILKQNYKDLITLTENIILDLKENKNRDSQIKDMIKSVEALVNYSIERGFIVEEVKMYFGKTSEEVENTLNTIIEAIKTRWKGY